MSILNQLIEDTVKKLATGVVNDVKYTVVDLSVDSTVVSATPAVLVGLCVNTALSAHACLIKDNTTTVITIPASQGVGGYDIGASGHGVRCETSLVIDPDNIGTGSITVFWKEIV